IVAAVGVTLIGLRLLVAGAAISVNWPVNDVFVALPVDVIAPDGIEMSCKPAVRPPGSVNVTVSASLTVTPVAGTPLSVKSVAATEPACTAVLKLTTIYVGG